MMQFYFLAILFNLVLAIILLYGKNLVTGENVESSFSRLTENTFFNDGTFRLIIAILSAFIGIMTLLSPVQGDTPVVGDLLPSLSLFAGSASLILEYYRSRTSNELNLPQFVNFIFVENRKTLGIASCAFALLHFIFPNALFL